MCSYASIANTYMIFYVQYINNHIINEGVTNAKAKDYNRTADY